MRRISNTKPKPHARNKFKKVKQKKLIFIFSEWTKKLEAIVYLIFDYMKSKIVKNESAQARSAILPGNNKEANFMTQYADNKKDFKHSKASNEASRSNSNFYRSYNENSYDNLYLKNLVDNLFEYIADQNNKEKSFNNNNNNRNEMLRMLGDKEKLLALENIDSTKIKLLDNDFNENLNNNKFNVNVNNEFLKKNIQAHLNDESLNKFLSKSTSNNSNSNCNNLNDTLSKTYFGENGTRINQIDNDSSKGKSSALGVGFSTQVNNEIFNNNQRNLNLNATSINGKSKANQIITNSNSATADLKMNESNLNKINTNSINTNKNTIVGNTSKNFKLNLSDQNNTNNNLKNSESLIANFNANTNPNTTNNLNYNKLNINQALNNQKIENISQALNEDDKSIFMKTFKSPNPFEDYNSFGHQNSNLFNSPNPMETITFKLSNEAPSEKMNFNFDLSRNSTLDYNEIFKSAEGADNLIEEKKLPKENNLFFDDSFFSISSNDKKSEANSEPIFKTKCLEDVQEIFPASFKSLN